MPPTPGQQARVEQIAAEITAILAAAPYSLPGTFATRMAPCGHVGCRCHADPPQLHGPYRQWTRKHDAKTVTRILGHDQAADYEPWFSNHKRIRHLLTELEQISIDITENDPRRNRRRRRRTRKTP
ncbi:MAG TPA: DUF6788 family protein [Streptosporangiaceae bacterium]|nr:DUF6788 family protein [Streptosporangiaceae bacterium]